MAPSLPPGCLTAVLGLRSLWIPPARRHLDHPTPCMQDGALIECRSEWAIEPYGAGGASPFSVDRITTLVSMAGFFFVQARWRARA